MGEAKRRGTLDERIKKVNPIKTAQEKALHINRKLTLRRVFVRANPKKENKNGHKS